MNRDEQSALVLSTVGEFAGLELGDGRLNQRAMESVARLADDPARSYPKAFPANADLEGWYRLLRNDRVSAEALLEPHVRQTHIRCQEHRTVLAVADTTAFHFGGQDTRQGLAPVRNRGHGFFAHTTMAVAADGTRDPLGVLGVKTWARTGDAISFTQARASKELRNSGVEIKPSEKCRWWDEVYKIESSKPEGVSFIHVTDREADSYSMLSNMSSHGYRFVIRYWNDKRLDSDGMDVSEKLLLEYMEKFPERCARDVRLSPRGKKGPVSKINLPREGRLARLSMSAAPLTIRVPQSLRSKYPPTVRLNVVRIWETQPPEGVQAVKWLLLTQEPIDTDDQLLAIADIYRTRWVTEEFYMAVKTGCAYETRQLESLDTLVKALSLTLPLAWALLRLRNVGRETPDAPADKVLTNKQLTVLRLHCQREHPKIALLNDSTAGNAMLAVAKLGGHIKWNGPPGWRTLAAGYFMLLRLVQGYDLAVGAGEM